MQVAAYGELVDRKGPRKTFLVGMVLACIGLGIICLNMQLHSEPLWYVCFWCLGASGPGIFFSVIFLSEKHPQLQPIISAVASATFDGSALCFYLWNAIYFRTGIGLAAIAGGWLLLSILLAVATVVQLPSWAWLKRERSRRSATSATSMGTASSRSELVDGELAVDAEDAEPDKRSGDTADRAPALGGCSAHSPSRLAAEDAPSPERTRLDTPLITPLSPPGTPADPLSVALRHAYYGEVTADAEESVHRASRYCPPGSGRAAEATTDEARRGETRQSMSAAASTGRPERAPISTEESGGASSRVNGKGTGGMGGGGSGGSMGGGSGGSSSRLLPQVFLRTDTLLLIGSMAVVNLKASYYIISFSDSARTLFDEGTAKALDTLFNIGAYATCDSARRSADTREERQRVGGLPPALPHPLLAPSLHPPFAPSLCTLPCCQCALVLTAPPFCTLAF